MDWPWAVLILSVAATVAHVNYWFGVWARFQLRWIEENPILDDTEGPYGDPSFGELDPEIAELIGDE